VLLRFDYRVRLAEEVQDLDGERRSADGGGRRVVVDDEAVGPVADEM
jgi:hypothetical protein